MNIWIVGIYFAILAPLFGESAYRHTPGPVAHRWAWGVGSGLAASALLFVCVALPIYIWIGS